MAIDKEAWKQFIGPWVAYKLFPGDNGSIDKYRDISSNCKAHDGTIAVEVNFLADQVAETHELTWENVTPDDIRGLNTVGDLVNLVIGHLSYAEGG